MDFIGVNKVSKSIQFLGSQFLTLVTGVMLGAFAVLALPFGSSFEFWSTFGSLLTGLSCLGLFVFIVKKAHETSKNSHQETYHAIKTELIKSILEESSKVLHEVERSVTLNLNERDFETYQDSRTSLISSIQSIINTVSALESIGLKFCGKTESTDVLKLCKNIEEKLLHHHFNNSDDLYRHQTRQSAIRESHRLKSLIHMMVKRSLKSHQ